MNLRQYLQTDHDNTVFDSEHPDVEGATYFPYDGTDSLAVNVNVGEETDGREFGLHGTELRRVRIIVIPTNADDGVLSPQPGDRIQIPNTGQPSSEALLPPEIWVITGFLSRGSYLAQAICEFRNTVADHMDLVRDEP
ncbi:MAG: hypothetical protein KC983_05520 [Phycisphaerales bacterium]|nr:hypothetical protein [Phycisphaerales bacterium]